MSNVVCLTDEIVQLQLERLGAMGPLLVRALADALRSERTRRAGPAAGHGTPRQEGQVRARDERIDFRPQVQPRFELRVGRMNGRTRKEARSSPPTSPTRARFPAQPHSVRLGNRDDVARSRPDWLRRSQLIAVGELAPEGRRDSEPRRPRELSLGRQTIGGYPWVSLIAIRGEEGLGWSSPQFRGWITLPGGHGGYVTGCGRLAVARGLRRGLLDRAHPCTPVYGLVRQSV